VLCPSCGLSLPAHARFCARCGTPLGTAAGPRSPEVAPVWVQVLLWLGAAGLLGIAITYAVLAAGLVPSDAVGPGQDVGTLRSGSALLAACAASLSLAHLAAALGLAGRRAWGRLFATMVFVVWALTCVGLPVALFAISTLWRARGRGGAEAATSRPSP
jgi:zinc-ribbon domain